MPSRLNKAGQIIAPGHPDYDKVGVENLEAEVRALTVAIVDLQHRVARLDREDVDCHPWNSYPPTHTAEYRWSSRNW